MDDLIVVTWRLPRVDAAAVESVTLPAAQRAEALREIRDAAGAQELVYVPTCQRVVVALLGERADASLVRAVLHKRVGRDVAEPETFTGRDAFRHLAEVASSLDSFVVGEPQVLGQFKESLRASEEDGAAGAGLRHVFALVFRVAKAVRTETSLFRGKVSLLPLTEGLVERHLAQVAQRPRAVVLGSGQMGARMARLLREKRPDIDLLVVSRDAGRAAEAARALDAAPLTLADLLAAPPAADLVACVMEADAPVLDARTLETLAAQRDVLVLDLAVPRNTQAPERATPRLTLVQMDDLSLLSERNRQEREREIDAARAVLDAELARVDAEYAERRLAHDLAHLAARFDEVARERLARAPAEGAAFDKWFEQTVRALLHEATTAVKEAGCPKK